VKKKKKVLKGKKPIFGIPYYYFYLAIGFVFTFLLLGGTIFISGKLSFLSGEVEQKKSQLIALQERDLSFKRLKRDLLLVEEEAKIINQSLPDEEGIILFIREVKKIGQEVSFEVFDFETDQPVTDGQGNAYIGFGMEAKGELNRLTVFLERLVKLPFLIRLQMIDINSVSPDESQMIIKAKIYVDQPFFRGELI